MNSLLFKIGFLLLILLILEMVASNRNFMSDLNRRRIGLKRQKRDVGDNMFAGNPPQPPLGGQLDAVRSRILAEVLREENGGD